MPPKGSAEARSHRDHGAHSLVPGDHTFPESRYASDFHRLSLKFLWDFILSARSLVFSLNHSYTALHAKQKDRVQVRNSGMVVVCDCLSSPLKEQREGNVSLHFLFLLWMISALNTCRIFTGPGVRRGKTGAQH